MFFLERVLSRWEKAGLLSEDQAQELRTFEKTRTSGQFITGLMGVGVFVILLGILSLVAANWHTIHYSIKLVVMFAFNILAAFAIFHYDRCDKPIKRELAILAYFGFIIISIVLIGQIFQLDNKLETALFVWMCISTPFVLYFSNSYISLLPWVMALIITITEGLDSYIFNVYPKDIAMFTQLFFVIGLPVIAVCMSEYLEKLNKKALANLFFIVGLIIFLSVVSFMSILLQFQFDDDQTDQVYSLFFLLCLAALVFAWSRMETQHKKLRHHLSIILYAGLTIVAVRYGFPDVKNDLLGAGVFIAFWLLCGWCGGMIGWSKLVTTALIIIAIRFFVIYLELLDSLSLTRFGWIASGILLLAMLYGIKRLNSVFKQGAES